jgi:hypothetical protein
MKFSYTCWILCPRITPTLPFMFSNPKISTSVIFKIYFFGNRFTYWNYIITVYSKHKENVDQAVIIDNNDTILLHS